MFLMVCVLLHSYAILDVVYFCSLLYFFAKKIYFMYAMMKGVEINVV